MNIKELNYIFPDNFEPYGISGYHLMISNEMNLGIYYPDNSKNYNIIETMHYIYLLSIIENSSVKRFIVA